MTDVAKLEDGDEVSIDHDELDGGWEVTDAGIEDMGLFKIPYAAIVQDDTAHLLVGNCTANDEDGENTVQVRDADGEERMFYVSPDDIQLV